MAFSENNGDYRLPHGVAQLAWRWTLRTLRPGHGLHGSHGFFFLILIREIRIRENPCKSVARSEVHHRLRAFFLP